MNIKSIIAKKIEQNSLPHFLIIKVQNEPNWREEFLDYYCQETHQHRVKTENALDLFLLTPSELKENQRYGQDDIAPLFQFTSIAPTQWKHRLVIIESAHRLSEIVLNKMLKTLEEAPHHFYIFFLTDRDKQFLPTISSRAVQLEEIGRREKTSPSSIATFTTNYSPLELLEQLKQQGDHSLLEQALQWAINTPSIDLKLELLELLKYWEQSGLYNNPAAERAVAFAHLLSKHTSSV